MIQTGNEASRTQRYVPVRTQSGPTHIFMAIRNDSLALGLVPRSSLSQSHLVRLVSTNHQALGHEI